MAASRTWAATAEAPQIMGAVIGLVAIALMVVVLIIAIGSLLIVGTMPFAKFFANRRAQRDDDHTPGVG